MTAAQHDCIANINAHLKGRNTRIALAVSCVPDQELIQVTTAKVDETKRGRPVLMFASYCPFCGVKLASYEWNAS